jgi:hypothetical protein
LTRTQHLEARHAGPTKSSSGRAGNSAIGIDRNLTTLELPRVQKLFHSEGHTASALSPSVPTAQWPPACSTGPFNASTLSFALLPMSSMKWFHSLKSGCGPLQCVTPCHHLGAGHMMIVRMFDIQMIDLISFEFAHHRRSN